jgi:hypothetical protein
MLDSASLSSTEGNVGQLAETVLHGREIRTLTRIAKILHPTETVTLEQMRSVLR